VELGQDLSKAPVKDLALFTNKLGFMHYALAFTESTPQPPKARKPRKAKPGGDAASAVDQSNPLVSESPLETQPAPVVVEEPEPKKPLLVATIRQLALRHKNAFAKSSAPTPTVKTGTAA